MFILVAENIARGHETEAAVMEAWMAIPGHRDSIPDSRAEGFGPGMDGPTRVLLPGRQAG